MALNANYYTTLNNDQKIIRKLLRASFINFESGSNFFFFQKKSDGKL